jgi:hypothetical protein
VEWCSEVVEAVDIMVQLAKEFAEGHVEAAELKGRRNELIEFKAFGTEQPRKVCKRPAAKPVSKKDPNPGEGDDQATAHAPCGAPLLANADEDPEEALPREQPLAPTTPLNETPPLTTSPPKRARVVRRASSSPRFLADMGAPPASIMDEIAAFDFREAHARVGG